MTSDPFGRHMEVVAKHFWGDPNLRASTKSELRWGSQGARCVDLEKGVWYDNEAGEGGGVLDLVAREARVVNGGAAAYLKTELGLDLPEDRVSASKRQIVATYDYTDEVGQLLFQVVRFEPKDFRQRRPDPHAEGGWNWSVKGIRQVPYRLPDVLEALAGGGQVCIVEGEKDVDALWKLGVPATCNAGGAGKWYPGLAEHFVGADVVTLPDNDEAGRNHAAIVGQGLVPVARSVRTLNLPGLPPKGDVSDWIGQGGDGAALYALIERRAKSWTPAPPESRFGALVWSDLDRVSIRQDFLAEDLMFAGDIGMFYGASGSGKSFLAVDMGLSIARGSPFLGKKTRQGGVLYQAGEGGKGLIKRLRAYRDYHHIQGDVPFVLLPEKVDLFSREGDAEAFIAECQAWAASMPLAAIFIDTFSTASTGANENASEDMSRVLAAGQTLNRLTGAALIWIHHKNAAGDRERGHTSLRANIDTAMEVIRDEETSYRTLRLAKLKDGEDGLKIGFELQSVEIGSYDDGKPITSCVVVPAQEGSQRTGKRTRLPDGQFKFLKLLDDAIIQHGGILPPGERMPFNMRGVEWASFRDLYVVVLGHGKTDAAIRQAISRDGDRLFNAGVINRHGHWIWITDRGRAAL